MDACRAVFVKHVNIGAGLIFAQDSDHTYYFLNDTNPLELKHKTGLCRPVVRDICGSEAYLYLAVNNY